jgi:O-antigen/teichoic acid export membrane protein
MNWLRALGVVGTLALLAGLLAAEFGRAKGLAKRVKQVKRTAARAKRRFMRDSLYRNSTYLLLNMGLSAGAGFLFWALCAHLYSTQDIGYASAMFGGLGLATALSNLGINRTILRFLAKSRTRSADLITKLCLVGAGSLVTGGIISLFFAHFGLRHAGLFLSALFVGTVLLTSLKMVFDNVFIALRFSSGTLAENTVFNVAKLAIPALLVWMGFAGIFAAQFVGAMLAVVISVLLLVFRHQFKFAVKPTRSAMRGKWQFAFGSYTSDLIGGLPTSILPIVVLIKLGPTAGALWYTVMLVTNFLLMVNSSINQAMFAEISHASVHKMLSLIKKAAVVMYALMIPLVVIIFVCAPLILRLFHGSYVAAAPVLRMTSLFVLLGIVNYLAGSILALYKKVLYLTAVNAVNALIVLVYCFAFAHGLRDVAVGWMLGEVANIVLFVGGAWYVIAKPKPSTLQEAQ